jgi:dehydrogenase/reductase SDR family protein 1
MAKLKKPSNTLHGKVAVVTGASRGIGKGIAEALGECGATVYVTGRTEDKATATVPLSGTIHATAQAVTKLGGTGIAVRCDHSHDEEIKALFDQVRREQGQLDILVNNVWAGYQAMQRNEPGFQFKFWKMPPQFWDTMFAVGVRAHYIASVYAVQLMIPQHAGLIANISFAAGQKYTSNVAYGVSKAAVDRMTLDMAHELRNEGVAVVSIWPGTVKTEMLAKRIGSKKTSYIESPRFVGRGIAALAADPKVLEKSGQIWNTRQLAHDYQFTDIDGTLPPIKKQWLPKVMD